MNGSRRDFIKGAAGFASLAATWRLWAAAEGLPEYYADHLARAATRIGELSKTCADGFFFITDIHIPSNIRMSGRILAKLFSETPIRKVLCGGDLPAAFGKKESLDDTVAAYRAEWVAAVERAHGEFYPAKGNHDFTIRSAPDADDGFTYPGKETRDILMDTAAVKAHAVTNTDDPEACYYYVDLPKVRVRYIVADTTDSVNPSKNWWAVSSGIGERQFVWLAERALATLPDGWGAVVMHHIPVAGVQANAGEKSLFASWLELLEAYQSRGKATAFGRTFDFSAAKGRILFDLTGHHHCEMQSCEGGIWHITNPCDAAYKDYITRSQPWCPDLPVKTRGTVYEQTFDAVQIDVVNSLVHFTRIGGGGDRTIHLLPRRVKAGESIRFEASRLPAGFKWGAYDADRVDMRVSPTSKYTKYYTYFNDVGEVSEGGVFTAKKPGEAVVVALAPNGDKEMFAVEAV